ncbi:hypothetical protein [Luteolibacter sp. LG18]|uniref:hypothetical protein n=1 Tax=Luteolibacter sp. LG18 TaxID=2819286 RepID=UPI0030C700ED
MKKDWLIGWCVAVGLALVGTMAGWFLNRPDAYHSPVRRDTKEAMIAAVSTQVANGKRPPEPVADWLDERTIVCANGDWLAYRASCEKQVPEIKDLFIARASDGRWYYSTFHFCIGAMVLRDDGQPESLPEFVKRYALREFDGHSDAALMPTWP